MTADRYGHEWFGRVCKRCGTTSDRGEAREQCRETYTSNDYSPPISYVGPSETYSFSSDPTPTPDVSTPDAGPDTSSFDSGFSGGDSGGGGGGSDF